MEFTIFFLILLVALVFPAVLREFHIPWVVTLIVAGLVLGPSFLDIIGDDPVIGFLGEIGLIFLMFLAGLETNFSQLKDTERNSIIIATVNGLVPFTVGFLVSFYLGFEILASLIVGMVLMSSSAVVSLPSLEKHGIVNKKLGTTLLGSVVLQDLFSLLLVGILLHHVSPVNALPLPVFILLLLASPLVFRYSVPLIKELISYEENYLDGFETELRTVMAILIGAVAFYELIGLDAIVAGFITGLFLSDTLNDELLLGKIHALGYGLLIPIFFIQVGAEINLFRVIDSNAILTAALIVTASVSSKYGSGFLVSRNLGFNRYESSVIASASIPQLSTTLAVIYIGLQNNLITPELSGALIGLVVFTSMIGPSMINFTIKRWERAKQED